jgi:thiol-disulfide isomerase/thioredoxin
MRPQDSACTVQSPSRRRATAAIAACAGLAALGLSACGRAPDRPWIGARFPAFVLPALDGTMHDSRWYSSRPLLVNFWATWCPPCRREMADLDALDNKLGHTGLQLLAISVDGDRNLVIEYLRHEHLGLRVLFDRNQQWSAPALRIAGFPTTYLVGRDGIILDAWVGARAWADPATQAGIASRAGAD